MGKQKTAHRVRRGPQKSVTESAVQAFEITLKTSVMRLPNNILYIKDKGKQKLKLRNNLVNRGFNGWYLVSNWLTT